jgi:hypothetical protein
MAKVYAIADGQIYVEFENEAVMQAFNELGQACEEPHDWEVQEAKDLDKTYAVVTQADIDLFDESDKWSTRFNKETGKWEVKAGLEGWYATNLWDLVSDGMADDED